MLRPSNTYTTAWIDLTTEQNITEPFSVSAEYRSAVFLITCLFPFLPEVLLPPTSLNFILFFFFAPLLSGSPPADRGRVLDIRARHRYIRNDPDRIRMLNEIGFQWTDAAKTSYANVVRALKVGSIEADPLSFSDRFISQ